jgi:hypothetical protein
MMWRLLMLSSSHVSKMKEDQSAAQIDRSLVGIRRLLLRKGHHHLVDVSLFHMKLR